MEAIISNDFYFVIVSYLGKMSTFSLPLSLTVFFLGGEGCLGLVLFWISFVVWVFFCLWGGFLWFLLVDWVGFGFVF